jgi:uncharacterized protein DUF3551
MARKLAITLASLAALTVGPDPAAAQSRPWCLHEPGLATTCIYYTFEQCSAARVGSTTYCALNPNQGDASTGTRTYRERSR